MFAFNIVRSFGASGQAAFREERIRVYVYVRIYRRGESESSHSGRFCHKAGQNIKMISD